MASRVADLMARGQHEMAEAVVLLLLTALEQAQRDNGRCEEALAGNDPPSCKFLSNSGFIKAEM